MRRLKIEGAVQKKLCSWLRDTNPEGLTFIFYQHFEDQILLFLSRYCWVEKFAARNKCHFTGHSSFLFFSFFSFIRASLSIQGVLGQSGCTWMYLSWRNCQETQQEKDCPSLLIPLPVAFHHQPGLQIIHISWFSF